MRRAAWIGIAGVVVGLGLGLIARATDTDPLRTVAGLFFVVALVAFLTLLPWSRVMPPLPAMRDLFRRPRQGQRWCTGCGRPAPATGTCPSCGSKLVAKAARRR